MQQEMSYSLNIMATQRTKSLVTRQTITCAGVDIETLTGN